LSSRWIAFLLELEKPEQEIRHQRGNEKKMEDDIENIFTALKLLLSPPPTPVISMELRIRDCGLEV
jgi:hypothetical protein